MIPYEDLVIALQTWRAKQGLPVAQLSGALTPPPVVAAPSSPSAPSGPPAPPPKQAFLGNVATPPPLAEHAGYDPEQLVATRHVHGTNVWRFGEPLADDAEFDGLVCDRTGPVLGAFAADCIPLVFAEPEARVCGAAHAGWRGTVGGVARNVVVRMVELGAKPERIRVALGPSIGPECFEVGPEVIAEFSAAFGAVPGMIVDGPKKQHIDLRVATRTQLERAGLLPEHIDDRPPCTRCEGDRFFSYRRDGREGGIHMVFIGLA